MNFDQVLPVSVEGYEQFVGETRAEREAIHAHAGRRVLPDELVLQKVERYEGHLERSLLRTLHGLRQLQAARGGSVPQVPR
jgi:hypothetical protein